MSNTGYVDTEPSNWHCYRCGQETKFVFVGGQYLCDKCKQPTINSEEGAERFGQLPDSSPTKA